MQNIRLIAVGFIVVCFVVWLLVEVLPKLFKTPNPTWPPWATKLLMAVLIIGGICFFWGSISSGVSNVWGSIFKPDSADNPTEKTSDMTAETPATLNLSKFGKTGFRIVSDKEIRYTIPGVLGSYLYRPGDENLTSKAPAGQVKNLSEYNFSFWDPKDPVNGRITFKLLPL